VNRTDRTRFAIRFLPALLLALGLAVASPAEEGGDAPARGDEGEAPSGDGEEEPKTRAEALLDAYAEELKLASEGQEALGDYYYNLGVQRLQEGRSSEAVRLLRIAVDTLPDNEGYRKKLAEAEAIAGESDDTRRVMIDQVGDTFRVEQQRLWIEIKRHVADGQRHLGIGNFHQAEQSFQMAHIRLESLPFADELREPEMRSVERLLAITRERRQRAELEAHAEAVRGAQVEARQQALWDRRLEKQRLDMILRRALRARARRDFDQCILLCRQILSINGADQRANRLLIQAQRERHVYLRKITADKWDEEHKLLSEHIRKTLLPQTTIIEYPDNWHEIDARRSAPTRTGAETERAAWREQVDRNLQQSLTLEFVDTDITDVVQFLIQHTDINFVLDPEVIAQGVNPVTMQVTDITVEHALDFIMQLTGLRYTIQDEAVFISNREGVRGDIVMKIYEIRDLTMGLTQFPGPTLELPEPGGTGSTLIPEIADDAPPDVGELMDIIQNVVERDSWEDPASIDEINGSMVINQTPEIHEKIEELLRTLRNQRAVQIHVKVKFLEVENAMLEEIKFEWRDFVGPPVNSSNAIGNVGGTPVAFAPVGATGLPYSFGSYYNHNDYLVNAGRVGNPLSDFFSQTNLRPTGGLLTDLQLFQDQNGVLARLLISAVEKTRRGNIMVEPDLTLFSGQRAHVVRMNQQSYISDYDIVNGQYDPLISQLSFGTVLDVLAIASADRRYITMTLRPADASVAVWRRFGPPVDSFPGGPVEQVDQGLAVIPGLTEFPLLIPQLNYNAVQTTVTIPDGGSLLIGGMNRSNTSRAHTGVPFLSHIPFLGRLFSSNGRTEQELKNFIYVSGDILLLDEIEEGL